MQESIRARVEFDASHTDTGRPRCARRHGHHFVVTVETGSKVVDFDLEVDLHALISEWEDKDLNEQLHADRVSTEQLTRVVCERLLMRHPKITRVEVDDGRLTGIVTQEIRQ